MIKKLCIFTISFAFNRQVMINFLEDIMPNNVELYLFVSKECKNKFTSKRIKIYESDYNKYFCFFDLRKFCKKNKIQRIFSMGALPQEAYLMFFSTFLTRTDFIPHLVVNPFDQYKIRFYKPAIKAFFELLFFYPVLPFTKFFYVGAHEITTASKRYFFFIKNRIKYLKMPIDTNLFSKKYKAKEKLSLKNKKTVIYVGRIEWEKGSDIILHLAKKNSDILFLLIGQLFDKKIQNSKLKNIKIIPPKTRKELLDYYNAVDLGIFPSRVEAGPLVARECMACGIPVLVSNIRGPKAIKPALKSQVRKESFNKELNRFFNLSKRDRKYLSKTSREYIVAENSEKVCKSLYINFLINS